MGKKIYVGNLPYSATSETLNESFSVSGTVESAQVIQDRDSGRSRGFGFVEMSTDDEAEAAVAQFNGKELDGRALTVNIARPMTPKNDRSGGNRRERNFGGNSW